MSLEPPTGGGLDGSPTSKLKVTRIAHLPMTRRDREPVEADQRVDEARIPNLEMQTAELAKTLEDCKIKIEKLFIQIAKLKEGLRDGEGRLPFPQATAKMARTAPVPSIDMEPEAVDKESALPRTVLKMKASGVVNMAGDNSSTLFGDRVIYPSNRNNAGRPGAYNSDIEVNTGDLDIGKILEFIRNHDSSEKYKGVKKVVLLLGCTGNGKSTLTQLLTGNRSLRCVGSRMGQYVIEDENGRIGSVGTTILSHTTYPENIPYPGSDTETYLLDCPGFQDTRSSSMDVACTIFTKKALKNCLVAKIVLVISYEEVKLGGQRNAFLELVKHASEFIKDFEKFRNGIALFVTKVPNIVDDESRDGKYVSDDNMKKHIIQFLESVRETISAQVNVPYGKRSLYQNTILLTNIMLQRGPRIGILRCPDRQGLLHEVSTIRQSKADLDDIIQRVLEFTQISEDDFGYSISGDSKLCIEESVKEIINTVTGILSKILEQIEYCYQTFENKTENIETLYQNFSEHYTVWKDTAEKLSSSVITREVFSCVLRHVEYLFSTELLKEFGCEEATTELTQYTAELNGYIDLLELLETVSNLKYQVATSKLQTILGKASDAVRSSSIWYQSFPNFYKQLTSYDVQQRKSFSPTLNFMDSLNKCIQSNTPISGEDFTKEFNAFYEGGLGVQLNFEISVIKLKRFHRLCKYAFVESTTSASGESLKSAGNIVLLSSVPILDNEGVTDVEIFAGNKVFIDCDLEAVGKRLQIFIAAPEWEVVGEHRRLILDGAEGHAYRYPAKNGDQLRSNGGNGNPGQPGECGGNFFGIGDKMRNGNNLAISVSGGKGGVGQAGGDGRPPFSGRGGNGGDGGCGGIGGFPGDISLLGFKDDALPCVIEKCGDVGENGKGGKAGVNLKKEKGKANDGQNGKDGSNKSPLCPPKCNKIKNFLAAVQHYKLWFTENVKINPIQNKFESFICRLEKASKIADFGNIEILAAELAQIELKIVRSNSDIEYEDEYKLLLHYIKCFLNNITELTFEVAKIICFIYIIASFRQKSDFSKISNLAKKAYTITDMMQDIIFSTQDKGNEAALSEQPYSSLLKFETNAFIGAIYDKRNDYEMLVQEVDRIAGAFIPPCFATSTEAQISNFVIISESKLSPTPGLHKAP